MRHMSCHAYLLYSPMGSIPSEHSEQFYNTSIPGTEVVHHAEDQTSPPRPAVPEPTLSSFQRNVASKEFAMIFTKAFRRLQVWQL